MRWKLIISNISDVSVKIRGNYDCDRIDKTIGKLYPEEEVYIYTGDINLMVIDEVEQKAPAMVVISWLKIK